MTQLSNLDFENALERMKLKGYFEPLTIELEHRASYEEVLKCVGQLKKRIA